MLYRRNLLVEGAIRVEVFKPAAAKQKAEAPENTESIASIRETMQELYEAIQRQSAGITEAMRGYPDYTSTATGLATQRIQDAFRVQTDTRSAQLDSYRTLYQQSIQEYANSITRAQMESSLLGSGILERLYNSTLPHTLPAPTPPSVGDIVRIGRVPDVTFSNCEFLASPDGTAPVITAPEIKEEGLSHVVDAFRHAWQGLFGKKDSK